MSVCRDSHLLSGSCSIARRSDTAGVNHVAFIATLRASSGVYVLEALQLEFRLGFQVGVLLLYGRVSVQLGVRHANVNMAFALRFLFLQQNKGCVMAFEKLSNRQCVCAYSWWTNLPGTARFGTFVGERSRLLHSNCS